MERYDLKQGLQNIREKGLAYALQEDLRATKERLIGFAKETFTGLVMLCQPVTLYQDFREIQLAKIPARERMRLIK